MIIHTPWALRTFLSTLSLRRATPRLSRVVPTPIFLSTLSLRRATSCGLASHQIQKHFYPRSPCGERHTKREVAKRTTDNFYPRSPCGERPTGPTPVPIAPYFYPRSPCGERQQKQGFFEPVAYFYPRSPCGERRERSKWWNRDSYFYPRSPCGERRTIINPEIKIATISIHALLAESDKAASSHYSCY